MEKFYTIIRIKENQLLEIQKRLQSKDIEIKSYKQKTYDLEKEINELKQKELNINNPGLYLIIQNLKNKWILLENEIQIKITERNDIFSELMIKKQEIRSIEMLIEKKKKMLNDLTLKKEQDILDELNSLD